MAFLGQLEVFFLSLAKIQILYYIGNQFVIKFYSFYDSPYIKDWGKANDYCLVLEIANITVGAIWIRFLKNGYGYINDTIPELCMSLLKDFRNQGLGSLLIKRMLDDIKSLGYRHISLSVSKDNYAAGWYRKLGFKVYKEQKEDYIMIVDL